MDQNIHQTGVNPGYLNIFDSYAPPSPQPSPQITIPLRHLGTGRTPTSYPGIKQTVKLKKDYTVLLIQLDGNLASDVSTRCSGRRQRMKNWRYGDEGSPMSTPADSRFNRDGGYELPDCWFALNRKLRDGAIVGHRAPLTRRMRSIT